ncbi:MAG: chorismate mutase [Treponema sp.]|nr:chorismate mutase [Treponema sp.]
MEQKRLFALRGAVQCFNDMDDIQKQTISMYDELLSMNKLEEKDIVSIMFSVTGDLDAINPATALRKRGRAGSAALFVTQEAMFPGSLDRVIRVLIHCYLDASQTPFHVYRNGAEALRNSK